MKRGLLSAPLSGARSARQQDPSATVGCCCQASGPRIGGWHPRSLGVAAGRRQYYDKVWYGRVSVFTQECVREFALKFFDRHGFPGNEHMGVEIGTYLECSRCKVRWPAGGEKARDVHAILDLPLNTNAGTSVQGLLDSYLEEEVIQVPTVFK